MVLWELAWQAGVEIAALDIPRIGRTKYTSVAAQVRLCCDRLKLHVLDDEAGAVAHARAWMEGHALIRVVQAAPFGPLI